LEHLESLNIDLLNKSIFEFGAGIGDHTKFLLNKGCSHILATEGRKENVEILKHRFIDDGRVHVESLDLENPEPLNEEFDIGYCYGLLYHLTNPEEAINFMASHIKNILLLETCVSYNEEDQIVLCNEDKYSFSQSIYGVGCKPGRKWLFHQLKKHFQYVYLTITQPDHDEFPLDWTQKSYDGKVSRSVFIASKNSILNASLFEGIPYKQQKNTVVFDNLFWNDIIQF